jgi:hypothetical protein
MVTRCGWALLPPTAAVRSWRRPHAMAVGLVERTLQGLRPGV